MEITSQNSPFQLHSTPSSKHVTGTKLSGRTMAPGKKTPVQAGEKFNRDILTDLERLKSHFCANVIVTLNEEKEFTALQIPDILLRIQGLGMESVFYPIKDMHIPTEKMESFVIFVDKLVSKIRDDKVVVIHCNAGKGRSGLVAACCLLRMGMGAQKAITTVRAARPGAIQTWAQEKFIRDFEYHIKGT
eukprot:Phypoly_transcript_17952.p1 GENE.Phypoly_transcript_17952~~Phypoly_transcript_17952.p1  ORF type:complete len:189 (+),score=25.30 Phypoly_transcript_17952:126-692(+)